MAKVSKRPPFADVAEKEPTWRHRAMADWLTKNTGYEADEKSVQLSLSLVNEFRQSDEFRDAAEARYAERKREEAERAARAVARKRERAEKLRAQLADIEAELPDPEPQSAKIAKRLAKPKVKPKAEAETEDELAVKRAAKPKAKAKKATPPPPPPVEDDDDEWVDEEGDEEDLF